MTKFEDLKAKLQILAQEAEEARQRELGTALSLVRDVVKTYGIFPEQINPAWSASAGTRRKEPPSPKYRNPVTGQTWCGRGRTPKWMAGYAREDFLIVPTAQ
ncbi:H-NS histone family protein [Burkholderia sp. BDU5]|uniref:H-NS histone family protein n=1 Tax=Burkholderia sp. BDU5 TaxID=1385590 RepID=UPI0009E8D84F|nr:H-NS histone family protein [Burkholderia sp. BDU5]